MGTNEMAYLSSDDTVEKLVDAMTTFAVNTKSDKLSVHVARVANRLQHAGKPFEKPLTRQEHAVIRPFVQRLGLQMSA